MASTGVLRTESSTRPHARRAPNSETRNAESYSAALAGLRDGQFPTVARDVNRWRHCAFLQYSHRWLLRERFPQRRQLIEERLCDRSVKLHRHIPRHRAAEVPHLFGVGYNLIRCESRRAAAPFFAEKTQHVNLNAVHFAVSCAARGDQIRLVDFAAYVILVRAHRENAIYNARIERHT